MKRRERITAFRQLGLGRLYTLPELPTPDAAQWVTFGSAPGCGMVLEDHAPLLPTDEDVGPIASVHGSVLCSGESVTIYRHRIAEIRINGALMVEGRIELEPGDVIGVGNVRLVACGKDTRQIPKITAMTMSEVIQTANAYHGNAEAAGHALNVSGRTMRNWIKKKRFFPGIALVALICGSGVMLIWGAGAHDNRPVSAVIQPAPAATGLHGSDHRRATGEEAKVASQQSEPSQEGIAPIESRDNDADVFAAPQPGPLPENLDENPTRPSSRRPPWVRSFQPGVLVSP